MRDHVNVIFNDDKIDPLVWELFLIRMIGNHPDITLAEMKNYLFEWNIAIFFQPIIFIWIPINFHGNNVHHLYVHVNSLIVAGFGDSINGHDRHMSQSAALMHAQACIILQAFHLEVSSLYVTRFKNFLQLWAKYERSENRKASYFRMK